MKTISLKVPDPFEIELAALAQERGMSKSALVREALETYVRRDGGARRGSALSLVADLAGTLTGPEDLSVNKDYMRGFGR